MINIKIVNLSENPLPEYKTLGSAGMDLQACIRQSIVLKPLERCLVPTGLFLEIPEGFEAQVRPRSGLAIQHGITVLNTPGTIDSDYRGEVKVIMINLSNMDYAIQPGDRIAQIIVAKHERAQWIEANELSGSERGAGGFGHTGKQ